VVCRGFESPAGHGKEAEMSEIFAAQIDGQTFLSRQEVDEYYEMLAEIAQAEADETY
jgi:hypothetical protein